MREGKTINKQEQGVMNQKWPKWVRGAQIKRSKIAAKSEKKGGQDLHL